MKRKDVLRLLKTFTVQSTKVVSLIRSCSCLDKEDYVAQHGLSARGSSTPEPELQGLVRTIVRKYTKDQKSISVGTGRHEPLAGS